MSDFDAQLPVRAIPTEFATEVANSSGTIVNPVEEFPQGSTTSGQAGPLDQGAVTTAAPTYVDGTTAPLSLDINGNLRTTASFAGLQDVNITEVGGNPVTTTVPVSGTITVTQATGTNLHTVVDNFPADADALAQGSSTSGQLGALDMGATTTAAPTYVTGTTNPLSLDVAGNLRVSSTVTNFPALQDVNLTEIGGNAITTTVPVSGTVAVSNFPADADALAQGSATSGQLGALEMGATTTAAPTYTTATTNPLSLDTAGNLRVLTGTGSTTAVTGNVTVVQPTGTNLHAVIDNFPADADALAQGSTTSGQLGALDMGAVTTAAPTYTTGTTNPISIDTTGNLRVVDSHAANITPVILTYFTDAAVATNATVTHSVAGPCSLDAIHSAGSGEIKMTVAIGVTASEVVYWNGFTLAATNCEFALKNSYVIPTGSSVKVTLMNRDKAAQDLYLTFVTH